MSLEDITMAQVMGCMTEDERKLFKAVIETGASSIWGIASMLIKQTRRDADQLMHGGSGA